MNGIPIGNRYRALREGADAAAADVIDELRRRHEHAEERAALANALVRAAKALADESLAELIDENMLAYPPHTDWRLAQLTGLSEQTIRARRDRMIQVGIENGTLAADHETHRIRRAEGTRCVSRWSGWVEVKIW